MILASLILYGVIIGGLIGIARIFWPEIHGFLKRAILKVQQVIQHAVHGAKILVRKVREGIQEISRTYVKVDNHWEETTTTRIVAESEVPEDIRAKAAYSEETDITDKMELVLENAG